MGAFLGFVALVAAVMWLCWPKANQVDRADDSSPPADTPPYGNSVTKVARYLAHEQASKTLGLVDGRHFSTYAEEVKQLKRDGRYDEAADLLRRLIEAAEQVSAVTGGYAALPGSAPTK